MTFAPKREWCGTTAVALLMPGGFIFSIAMFLAGAVQVGHIGAPQATSLVVLNWLAFYHLLPFLFTSYEIAESELVLRVGLHPQRVPLRDIFAVEASRGQLGMPAWSNDALKIRYHRNRVVGDYVVISPRDKDTFLAELERRVPGVQRRIVRHGPAIAVQ